MSKSYYVYSFRNDTEPRYFFLREIAKRTVRITVEGTLNDSELFLDWLDDKGIGWEGYIVCDMESMHKLHEQFRREMFFKTAREAWGMYLRAERTPDFSFE